MSHFNLVKTGDNLYVCRSSLTIASLCVELKKYSCKKPLCWMIILKGNFLHFKNFLV